MKNNKSGSGRKEYIRGFTVSLIIFITGSILEAISGGRGLSLPSWPMNLFFGMSFAFILVFLHFFYSDVKAVRWLSRVPASVSSIVLFTFLTLVLGLTIQNNPEAPEIFKITGLSHVRHSYTFLLAGLYLLTTLGLVILRRINKFNYRNIGFMLNHLGLWIIVLAGSLGAGDLKRINLYVNEGEAVWYGYTNDRKPYELPFTVKLIDFDIDYFSPKLAYIESSTFKIPENIENNLVMIEEGMQVEIANWNIEVEEYFPAARMDSLGNYYASSDTSAVPVAKISAKHSQSGKEAEGYISSGGIMRAPMLVGLNERYSVAMARPEPREYSSLLEITNPEGKIDTTKLIVNEPVKVGGWNLYQLSYDERLGKWSRLSVIEAIRDPWLVVIYIGIYMVIAGSLYLFTIGKKPEEDLK
jgi:hypothetical protein